jgi:hypothetical protein
VRLLIGKFERLWSNFFVKLFVWCHLIRSPEQAKDTIATIYRRVWAGRDNTLPALLRFLAYSMHTMPCGATTRGFFACFRVLFRVLFWLPTLPVLIDETPRAL